MTGDPARAYRESAVRGASPVGLIVILYEEIIRSIRRAQRAHAGGCIEERTNSMTHAIRVVGHLQGVLDFEKGGPLARELFAFYGLARTKLLEASAYADAELMHSLATEFENMKQAWQRVEHEMAPQKSEDIPDLPPHQTIAGSASSSAGRIRSARS
jgi:flagellar secretion chaperone FliS